MKNIILTIIVIFLPFFLNHQLYGNSNSTISNYEIIKEFQHKQEIKNRSKPFADYMYNRIKFYQKFDTWYERYYALKIMYEALQNME